MIAVIDYGMGNLRSVAKALEHLTDDKIIVTADAKTIQRAERVVFPGQGAIGDCMSELDRLQLCELVGQVIKDKPFLGICMGMQVLMEWSEENKGVHGLGVFAGKVQRFPADQVDAQGERLKIPHMGWNQVYQTRSHPLWKNIPNETRFYFVHSYYVVPGEAEWVTGTSIHGLEFACALAHNNVFATQFHPEKSQKHGLQLLHNFIHWRV